MRRSVRAGLAVALAAWLGAGPAVQAQSLGDFGRVVGRALGRGDNTQPTTPQQGYYPQQGYPQQGYGQPGYAQQGGRRDENAACAGGGLFGGAIGSALFGRNRVAGALVGGVGGCLIAKAIAHELNENEQRELARRTAASFEGGPTQSSYYSQDNHKQVTIIRDPEYGDRQRFDVEALQDVRAPRGDDFVVVAHTYYAREPLRLLTSTEPDAAEIGGYRKGAAVFVMGRSRDGRWDSIGHNGVLVGYVAADSLGARPVAVATAAPRRSRRHGSSSTAPAADTSNAPVLARGGSVEQQPKTTVRIAAETSCAKAHQQVGGATGLVTGCKSPTGRLERHLTPRPGACP